MKRTSHVVWNGNGKDGNGTLSTQSGALKDLPYSFKTRFQNDDGKLGTNPEELIAAAHAGCFNMKLSFVLNENDFYPDELTTDAELTFVDGVVESIELKLNANEKKQFNNSVKAVKILTNSAQKLIKKRQY